VYFYILIILLNAIFVQVLVGLFWFLAAVCNLSVVYGLYGDVNGYVHLSDFVRCLYAALHRTAWAVGVAWVIFACVTGNGGEFIFCCYFLILLVRKDI